MLAERLDDPMNQMRSCDWPQCECDSGKGEPCGRKERAISAREKDVDFFLDAVEAAGLTIAPITIMEEQGAKALAANPYRKPEA